MWRGREIRGEESRAWWKRGDGRRADAGLNLYYTASVCTTIFQGGA